MTALKPLENRRTRGVASERYPLNTKCSHPDCNEDAQDPHHIFPRSSIGNDSWFVEITTDSHVGYTETAVAAGLPECDGAIRMPDGDWMLPELTVIPHVTGLCRKHHDEVELHRAWIKLEDGVFVWYERQSGVDGFGLCDPAEWKPLGPLDPQPAGREKAHKPKRRKFQGEARRNRTVISIKVPKDAQEDGAGLLFDGIAALEEKRGFDPPRPPFYTLMEAVDYTNLNADATDFA